jgi:hypothetical protein
MLQGEPTAGNEKSVGEGRLSTLPPLVLCVFVLVLGIYLPTPLADVLAGAAALFGGARG